VPIRANTIGLPPTEVRATITATYRRQSKRVFDVYIAARDSEDMGAASSCDGGRRLSQAWGTAEAPLVAPRALSCR